MIRNYFTIAFRNFLRHKAFSAINLMGLTVGLSCSFFIFLWIYDELQFNRFHIHHENIYQVMQNRANDDGSIYTWGNTPYPLSVALEDYPAIRQSVQLTDEEALSISVDKNAMKASSVFASSNFFEVFSFPLLQGNHETALDEVFSVVISQSLSERLFGSDNALGKTIYLNAGEHVPFTVTGIFENVPHHSTLQFEMVLPMQVVLPFWGNYQNWGNTYLTTYLLIDEKSKPVDVESQIANLVKKKGGLDHQIFLLSLVDSYLYTQFENGEKSGGRIDNIRLFLIVALLILLIACINFVNLTTARATRRAREVGVRKAIGASKVSLLRQFLSESVLFSFLALILATGLVVLGLPVFNQLTGKLIVLEGLPAYFFLSLLGVGLLTGLLAGFYPAMVLSSFRTAQVIKGSINQRIGSLSMRQTLVVFQFAVSLLLIAGTVAVYLQMEYIRTKNLGLDQENIIYMEMDLGTDMKAYKNDLQQLTSIKQVSSANGSFTQGFGAIGDIDWPEKKEGSSIYIPQISVDYDFIETFNIQIKDGRSFSDQYADSIAYILNEEAIKVLGLRDPLGSVISTNRESGPIVGIAEDFHFSSLHQAIEPLIIQLDPTKPLVLYVKAQAGKTEEALAALKGVHQKYSSYPLDYRFLDETMEGMYASEMLAGRLSRFFAAMAILISCLGLLGLAIYSSEQRTKEIGIRKVMGATVGNILLLLSRDYVKLILVAFFVGIPVANYFITEWLQNFAYRVEVRWWFYAIPTLAILLLAGLSVSSLTWKAARKNPVDSLRYE